MFWKRGSGRDDTVAGAGMPGRRDGPAGTDKVVWMDRFRSGRSLSPLRQAEAYWLALAEGGRIPRRAEIEPRALGNILPATFLLERVAPGIARFRVAGQQLCGLAGMELRGMPFSAFFTAAARPAVAALLERLFDSPAVAELSMTGKGRWRGAAPEARAILLPLADEAGCVNRALGVLVADGDHARPLRLDLTGHRLRPLPRHGPAGQDAAPRPAAAPPPEPPEPPGMAEAARPLAGRPPWLKVVK